MLICSYFGLDYQTTFCNMKKTKITVTVSLLFILFCLWYILAFYYISSARFTYKFELEWMEGSIVEHARIIAGGGNIFCAPSLNFVPFIYSPLYYTVCATLLDFFVNGLSAMRLISIISFSLTIFLMYKWVSRETGSLYYAIFSAAFYSACFELCGGWFDVARVDSLALLLIMLFFYIIRFADLRFYQAVAGLIFTLACLCKQSNMIAAAPFFIYAAISDFKKYYPLIVVSAISSAAAVIILNARSDGFFSYYAYYLPAAHAIDKALIYGFWSGDLLPKIPIAAALSLFYLVNIYFVKDENNRYGFYLSLASGLISAAWLARIHEGGYLNALMPACAAFALLSALALKPAGEKFGYYLKAGPKSSAPSGIVQALLTAQLLLLIYNPFIYIPSNDDLTAGKAVIEKINAYEGEVYIPYHPYLTLAAEKKGPQAHHMAVFDILRGDGGGKNFETINKELNDYISGKKAEIIIVDNLKYSHIDLIQKNYDYKGPVFNHGYFYPVSGMKTRPEHIFVKKK